ncbi:MAG: hypothetical protein BWZ10_03410 [candidate division BRC1 bacterium ADurb.BinA364]|nr:MAG: hypothetical protein BWZ10_03410 [candidate division BRC1 bacterium ADurb.BinA364]
MVTEAGDLKFYVGQARFTDDPIPPEFFGVAGVAEFDGLQDVLLHVGAGGYRHHVAVAPGQVAAPLMEAFNKYLGYKATAL